MKKFSKTLLCFVIGLSLLFVFSNVASALEILLEPATAQREIGGKVRVHIYATGAVDLISMGVKVTFDPDVLEVDSAFKYEIDANSGWVMDADGISGTTGDQYRPTEVEIDNANGTVTMLGGNINGTATTGFSGKVLLGWIVFKAIGDGNSDINVDLAKYHPNDPTQTFDNFVSINGHVDEPANVPNNLGMVCVVVDAVEGDANGNGRAYYDDYALLNAAWNSSFGDANYNPAVDFDADERIYYSDYAILNADWNRTTSCP